MPDASKPDVDRIIGRSLTTAEMFAQEMRARLVDSISERFGVLSNEQLVELARSILDELEPVFVQAMTDAEVAAWIAGVIRVDRRLPQFVRDVLEGADVFVGEELFGPEVVIKFPIIEEAAEDLLSRDVVTRQQFDAMTSEARRKAFTIARADSTQMIERVRDILAESVRGGVGPEEFKTRWEESVVTSRLGPAHIENVYRTNVQAAFHNGHDALADNVVVREAFPYQEYLPIKDGRTRQQHEDLAKLGLSGTGVYRREDPFWDLFRPPWDYQCRCGINLLTIEAAARKGVHEAQLWLETGERPPLQSRLPFIEFRPDPSFVS